MDTSILIKEAKRGSAAAQKCLFDLFAERMMMVCRRYVQSPPDAEERLLDGFYKFFRTIGSFSYVNDAALRGWLKKIMINECMAFLRKKNMFLLVSETAAEDIPFPEDFFAKQSAAEIFNLIVQLPPGYRTVFNLFVVEGMDHKEIATLLKISEGTSKSQLSKAKTLLQKMLSQNGIVYAQQKSK